MTSTAAHARTASPGLLWALRAAATLSVVNVVLQAATAGQILSQNPDALGVHGTGAIVLHVLSGLTAVAAGLWWNATRGPLWPTVLAVVVFVVTFIEPLYADVLTVHVPLAMLILVGATWVAAWAWRSPTRRPAG